MSASRRLSPRSGETVSSVAVTECILCKSGVVELLLRSPTRECEHPPEVCRQCLERAILKAFKTGRDMACPSKNCSKRMSRTDAQLWVTPTEPEQRRDNVVLPRDPSETESGQRSLEPGMPTGLENNNIVICHGGRHQGLHEPFGCDKWDRHQQNPTRQQEQVACESVQARPMAYPVPGYGGQARNVLNCESCGVPLHTIQIDNSKHREHCRYYGGTLHNTAPPEIAFNGANEYLAGTVARMNYVQPVAPLPALHFGQNTMVQNGNAAYNGQAYGLAGVYAFPPAGAYPLLPPFAPSLPQRRTRQYAEPSSTSSQTGAAPRGNRTRQISVESMHRHVPGLISSPGWGGQTPENMSATPTLNSSVGRGSPMDWQPSW